MAREPSATDIRLAADLAERGCDVSPRQIARWRGARVFAYERRFLGRGNGSSSSYDPGVVDLVEELDQLLKERRSLRDATLVLHVRGHDVDPTVVRDALTAYLDSVDRVLERVVDPDRGTTRTLLERSKEGRAILGHLDRAGIDENAFEDVIRGLRGENVDWVGTFLIATGFDQIGRSFLDGETLAELRRLLGRFTVPELRSLVERVNGDELKAATEESAIVLPFTLDFVELLARIANKKDVPSLNRNTRVDEELSIAHWALMALWARDRGLDLDKGVNLARLYGVGLRAALALARKFSYAQGAVFGPDGEAELERRKSYERESILKKARGWLQTHPQAADDIRALATVDDDGVGAGSADVAARSGRALEDSNDHGSLPRECAAIGRPRGHLEPVPAVLPSRWEAEGSPG